MGRVGFERRLLKVTYEVELGHDFVAVLGECVKGMDIPFISNYHPRRQGKNVRTVGPLFPKLAVWVITAAIHEMKLTSQ